VETGDHPRARRFKDAGLFAFWPLVNHDFNEFGDWFLTNRTLRIILPSFHLDIIRCPNELRGALGTWLAGDHFTQEIDVVGQH